MDSRPRRPALRGWFGLIVVLGISTAWGAETEVDRTVARAAELWGRGGDPVRTREAIALLREAIRLDEKSAVAWAQLARCHVGLGQFDEAFAAAERALQLNRDERIAHETVALAHQKLALLRPGEATRHHDAAVAAWRELARVSPGQAAPWLKLATQLRATPGREVEAEAAAREAVRLEPDSAVAHLGLGRSLLPPVIRIGPALRAALEPAIAEFRTALRLQADLVEAHVALFGALERAGRREEAEAAIRSGFQACRDVKGVNGVGALYVALGRSYLRTGDRAAAQTLEQELKAVDPSYPPLLKAEIARAMALARPQGGAVMVTTDAAGRSTERVVATEADARSAVQQPGAKTLVLLGDPAAAAFERGVAAGRAGRTEDELAAYREALRLRPEFAEAALNLGNALMRLRRPDEAIVQYRESVRLKPDYGLAHYAIGVWHGQRREWSEAIAAYRQAVRYEPRNAAMWFNLGNASLVSQRFDEAVEAFTACVTADPRYSKGWSALGLAHLFRGDRAAAERVRDSLRPLDAAAAEEIQGLLDGRLRLPSL